ncbi:hypothetical protein ANACAC_02991 [Anaerostipes caccae L1-92]|uniref:Uncharacterized protein n=1 Tax=Anaerostipes caccae (strain DSM 14662 / CCUG 47493 / JCM 13470 / NCIMB 13811 / L1-92) TaxID=411490 RepID=B0MHM9_ANACD|nr:hypothetical protein ANACAC_02991 [Anaerostipes caccae L1-92]
MPASGHVLFVPGRHDLGGTFRQGKNDWSSCKIEMLKLLKKGV